MLLLLPTACVAGMVSGDEVVEVGLGRSCVIGRDATVVVHRFVPLLDLRMGTGDSGLSLGPTSRTFAQTGAPPVPAGARCSWAPIRRYPRLRWLRNGRPAPTFSAETSLGLSITLTPPRVGLDLGYSRSTLVSVDPQGSHAYHLEFDSWQPEDTVFQMH